MLRGVRALGAEAPISIDDPIHLGSCGKAITSTLVARLIEEGLLAWDTTIAEAMPEFAESIDPGYHGVTVEQLLKHRAGIAERKRLEIAALHNVLAQLESPPAEARREILAKVMASPPLPPAPGTFDYSNFGYMTAGAMLEALTGKPWEELVIEHVFRPMELTSAGVGSPAGPDVPVGHRSNGDGWEPLPPGPGGVLPDAMGPAGLMHANLADWGKFVGAHLAGARGEDGFLEAETFRRLHQDPESSGYAAGWAITSHSWSWGEGKVLTHNGSDNTWFSVVFAMPEWDLTILVAANSAGAGAETAVEKARLHLLAATGFDD